MIDKFKETINMVYYNAYWTVSGLVCLCAATIEFITSSLRRGNGHHGRR